MIASDYVAASWVNNYTRWGTILDKAIEWIQLNSTIITTKSHTRSTAHQAPCIWISSHCQIQGWTLSISILRTSPVMATCSRSCLWTKIIMFHSCRNLQMLPKINMKVGKKAHFSTRWRRKRTQPSKFWRSTWNLLTTDQPRWTQVLKVRIFRAAWTIIKGKSRIFNLTKNNK